MTEAATSRKSQAVLHLTLSAEQTLAASLAAGVYARLRAADIAVVADLLQQGLISKRMPHGHARTTASTEESECIRSICTRIRQLLAHPQTPSPVQAPACETVLSIESARHLSDALDTLCRLTLGQLEVITDLVRQDVIPFAGPRGFEQRLDLHAGIEELIRSAKATLGFAGGGSLGISHSHVAIEGRRAYEINKVMERALAIHRNPKPSFLTVDYDGLGPRYTADPAPGAVIRTAHDAATSGSGF